MPDPKAALLASIKKFTQTTEATKEEAARLREEEEKRLAAEREQLTRPG